MATEMGADTSEDEADYWSEKDDAAARRVERRCGIALIPGGVED